MKHTRKYRGKKQDGGEWICGNLTVWSDGTASIDEEPTGESPLWAVIEETVGQGSTVLDKNGVEMYEGDIVYGAAFPEANNAPKLDVVPEGEDLPF